MRNGGRNERHRHRDCADEGVGSEGDAGPWVRAFDELTEEEYIESNPPCGIRFYGKGAYNCYNDADFIAFARQFVPQIIAEYERLKQENERLKGDRGE